MPHHHHRARGWHRPHAVSAQAGGCAGAARAKRLAAAEVVVVVAQECPGAGVPAGAFDGSALAGSPVALVARGALEHRTRVLAFDTQPQVQRGGLGVEGAERTAHGQRQPKRREISGDQWRSVEISGEQWRAVESSGGLRAESASQPRRRSAMERRACVEG